MIEYIDLKNDNLSDEDRLFYSPIAKNRILILCLGNTCRSIMFHSLLSEKLKNKNYEIFSAGIEVKENNISKNTKKILDINKIKIAKKVPTKIKDYMNNTYDNIIILDKKIKNVKLPNSKKVEEIYFEDPHGKNEKEYEIVLNKIKEEINKIYN